MERAKTAQRTTKINEMLNEFNRKMLSDNSAFDDFERKVETMEAAAESHSLFDYWFFKGKKSPMMTEDERLEMEFAKLEESEAVEKQMKMIKDDITRFGASRSSSSQAQEQWLGELLGIP